MTVDLIKPGQGKQGRQCLTSFPASLTAFCHEAELTLLGFDHAVICTAFQLHGSLWVVSSVLDKLLLAPLSLHFQISIYYYTMFIVLLIGKKQRTSWFIVFYCTDPALWRPDRRSPWRWQRSSSRCEDQPLWKPRGKWRWVCRSHCSTSSGSIWR